MKNIEQAYQKWLRDPDMVPELKRELERMDEKTKNDAFYTNLAFGTAGMRGLMGAGTNRLNIYTIRKANEGFARYIEDHGEEAKKAGVAISYDNRYHSREFAVESARMLASHGITSYLFDALRPTPELSFAVRHLHCFGGIMVTASHNPKEYNGYKLYDSNGCQLVPELIEGVIRHVNEIEDELSLKPEVSQQQERLIHTIGKDVDEPYYEKVLSIQLHPELSKENFRIVFTPQCGTANVPIHELFRRIGYDVVYVKEQCDPDPSFSGTLSPNPENPDAYKLALEYARKYDADIVLTTDPDADRLGVACRRGDDYVLLTGNQGGSVLLEYVLSQRKAEGKMPENPVMFNTVVTSDLGAAVAGAYGVSTEKTLTGFKFIGDKIHQYEKSHVKNFVFGYEESYGYLLAPFVRDKDSMQSCTMLAECANYYKKQGKTLLDVLHELFEKYGWYMESQQSIGFAGSKGAQDMKKMLDHLREESPWEIGGQEVEKTEDYLNRTVTTGGKQEKLEGFPVSDVLKYYLKDGSWAAVRPSGTEPKCKFYYGVRGTDEQDVQRKTRELQDSMQQLIK